MINLKENHTEWHHNPIVETTAKKMNTTKNKMNITNKETNIRITAVSLSETMQVKRQRNDIFKVLKEKKSKIL